MKIIKYALLTAAFVAGVWFLRPHDPTSSGIKIKMETKVAAVLYKPEPPARKPAALAKQNAGASNVLTSENLQKLNDYKKIKRIVFLTEKQKQDRYYIYANVDLVQNLKNYLLTPTISEVGSTDYQQRMLAVDLLIEASVQGKSAEATAAVLSIIEDNQIEDVKLPTLQRQSLAEVKADLLYIWTAQRPDQIEVVRRLIPGPVTASIWTNARAAQEQNRIESMTTN